MRLLIAAALALLFPLSAPVRAAGDLTVTAAVESREVPLNQNLVFSITITGAVRGVPEPDLPVIDGFTKVGQSSLSSISILNMAMTTSKKVTYTLQPQKKGVFIIPSVSFSFKGKSYTTDPIQVKVGDAVRQARRRQRPQTRSFGGFFDDPFSFRDRRTITEQDVFAKMEADKSEVYVNEEIILTFSLYHDQGLQFFQEPSYSAPPFKGLWVEGIPTENSAKYKILGNRRYIVSTVRHAAFAVSQGELIIGEANVTVQFDPFSSAFRVKSRPLKLNVKPLPPRPEGIVETSLVGSFGIYAELDKGETKRGEPVEVVVTVKGVGNIHSIRNPVPPDLAAFEIYGPEEEMTIENDRGLIEGEKRFKYILIPRSKGDFTVGAFKSAYFDPEKRLFKKLETGSFSVKVLSGKVSAGSNGASVAKSEVALLGKDIHYIKSGNKLLKYEGPLYKKPLCQLLIILPPVGFLVFFLYSARKRRLADSGFLKKARALKTARKRLGEMGNTGQKGDSRLFYTDIENTIRQYIGDKLNISLPSADPHSLDKYLKDDGRELMENLKAVFEKCSMARFAADTLSADDRHGTLKMVEELITNIEKHL